MVAAGALGAHPLATTSAVAKTASGAMRRRLPERHEGVGVGRGGGGSGAPHHDLPPGATGQGLMSSLVTDVDDIGARA